MSLSFTRVHRVTVSVLIVCAAAMLWNPAGETVAAQARALLASGTSLGDISSQTTLMAIGSLQLAAVVAFEPWTSRRRGRPAGRSDRGGQRTSDPRRWV